MAEITLEQLPKKTRDLFNKGFSAFERGNVDYAISLLTTCVELEPAFLKARKFLRAAAVQQYKKNPPNPISKLINDLKSMPAFVKATAAIRAGKNLQAIVFLERVLKIDPLNVKYVKTFAQAAAAADLPEAGIMTLEVARDHSPNDISVINWLGALYLKVGRTRSARECFEKLCELCPNDPAALKSLKDAMAIDSMSSDGWQEAADSGGTYRDVMKDEKEAALLEQEAKAVKSDKDVGALITDMIAKIEAEPENINYYRALAQLYAQRDSYEEAITTLKKAQAKSPGDPELDQTLSLTMARKFDYEIELLQAQDDPDGLLAKQQEKAQFLFDDLQERVHRYPNDLKLRFELGKMLFEYDYVNEAIQQFQLAQRNPKHRQQALFYLGMCFKKKGQHDLALQQLETASSEIVSMDATKKDILYELGSIAEVMGDSERAAGYYKQIYQVDISYKDIAAKIEKAYNRDTGAVDDPAPA